MHTAPPPPSSSMPKIALKQLSFAYSNVEALSDVSLSIPSGGITALVGPNGSGKTTLLRIIAGLETPLAGEVFVSGIDVIQAPRQARRLLGFLPDVYGLHDDLRVDQYLGYSAKMHGMVTDSIVRSVQVAVQRLHLEALQQARVGELSHGQRQRVALAASIVHQPPLLLLDEPANGLDPEAREDLASLFRSLAQNGITLVISSHILAELEDYATAILVLKEARVAGYHERVPDEPRGHMAVLYRQYMGIGERASDVPDTLTSSAGLPLDLPPSGSARTRFSDPSG